MLCNNFGDYRDFSLTLEVYLLAEVFEAFRGVCLKEYLLDPAQFFFSSKLELGRIVEYH